MLLGEIHPPKATFTLWHFWSIADLMRFFLEVRTRQRNEMVHIEHLTQGITHNKHLENFTNDDGGYDNDDDDVMIMTKYKHTHSI